MKASIETLLNMWARWAIRRTSGALGYPSVCPMFRDAPKGDAFGSAIPLGFATEDIEAVDAAVMRLPSVLRITLIEVYQRGGALRLVAGRMGVSHNSVCKYLKAAHKALDAEMFPSSAVSPAPSFARDA